MIIVEGPDGAGKSTLVETMREVLKYPVASRVVDKQTQALVDLQAWVEDNLMDGFEGVIYDRHRLISEPIYGPLLRAGQNPWFFNTKWLGEMYQQFYLVRPIMIYCLPSRETVKANIAQDDTNAVPAPHIDAIYDLYCARAMQDKARGDELFVNIYDYTKHTDRQLRMMLNGIGGYVHHRLDSN